MRASACLIVALLALAMPVGAPAQAGGAALAQEVEDAERAFARAFAERDRAGFAHYLADEAVFFGETGTLRGKEAVAEGWRPLFDGAAPFSWEPDEIEVVESGTLALSTGVVRNPAGQVVARFNSIWRQEEPGVWRVIFDRGQPVCRP